jgi:translation initiation factor IF-1
MIVRHDLIEAELKEQLPLISIEPPSSSASLTNRSRLADDARSHEVHCNISGKMHAHHIRIAAGDDVLVEMRAYDRGKGRIVFALLAANVTMMCWMCSPSWRGVVLAESQTPLTASTESKHHLS